MFVFPSSPLFLEFFFFVFLFFFLLFLDLLVSITFLFNSNKTQFLLLHNPNPRTKNGATEVTATCHDATLSLPPPHSITPPKIEPLLSGNLPPGFDSSTCRSVYVGNINPQITKSFLKELFASAGALERCKLIHKENSSYGFVHYHDHSSAAIAIVNLNGRNTFGQPIKVNWAYSRSKRENTSSHFNIFVGDLSAEVTDATLYAFFSAYSSRSDARVMWDHNTGCSLGYGFVSFRNQQDAQSAIIDSTGKWLGSKRIRCNWATKGANVNDENQSSYIMPTPPGTVSTLLPRPTSLHVPGFALSGLAEYKLQMALSKMSGVQAFLHQQSQHALKNATMGMGAIGAGYGTGFPSVGTTQHLI